MQTIDGSSSGNMAFGPCVQTVGFFDGVHRGHQFLLRQVTDEAARRGLQSMVVTFRQHPRQVLDPSDRVPQLTSLQEKLQLIGQCGVDYVALLDFTPQLAQTDARQYMEKILRDQFHGKVLVTGYDNRFGKRDGKGFDDYRLYGEELGIEVVRALPLPDPSGLRASSTAVRNALAEGDAATAARILGRPYSMSGTVVHGQAIGRTLGFPTANISLDSPDKLVPKAGVYAARVSLGDSSLRGMLYIGNRPSVRNHPELHIEVNLLDFNGEIYGRRISISVIDHIRDEQRFESLDQLQEQLAKDKLQTIRLTEEK